MVNFQSAPTYLHSFSAEEFGKKLGYPDCPWVRWEFSFGAPYSACLFSEHVSWNAIIDPGEFVANRYNMMEWARNAKKCAFTDKMMAEYQYRKLVHAAQQSFGQLINLMIKIEGSPEKVIKKLKKPGTPAVLDSLDWEESSLVELVKYMQTHEYAPSSEDEINYKNNLSLLFNNE